MTGLSKFGWFLIGLGVGIAGTTIVFRRELEKPIGEVEEYIPLEDREGYQEDESDTEDSRRDSPAMQESQKDIHENRGNGRERVHGRRNSRGQGRDNNREKSNEIHETDKDKVLDNYRGSDEDGKRSESRRSSSSKDRRGARDPQSTRYSRMYKDTDVEEAIHAANVGRESRESYEVAHKYGYETSIEADSKSYPEDSPSDDDYEVTQVYDEDVHEKYNLERVEDNIEIFLDDNPQDFVTLIFYEGDNTLCDDHDKIVPNAEEVVGYVALSRLIEGGPGSENGVIFVHNLKTSLNYEVVLDASSYSDTVIGQFESHLRDGGQDGNTR